MLQTGNHALRHIEIRNIGIEGIFLQVFLDNSMKEKSSRHDMPHNSKGSCNYHFHM